jgi:hypothetical protein
MRQQTRPLKEPAEKVVQDIRRGTRKHRRFRWLELNWRTGEYCDDGTTEKNRGHTASRRHPAGPHGERRKGRR